jgi:D-alanyl-D-alanine carboxypeptidase
MFRRLTRSRRILGITSTAALAVALTSGSAPAGQAPAVAPPPGVQQGLDAIVAAGIPGVVAYVRNGRDQWDLAAGVASRATDKPASPGDRFRIGSNTKAFISTVLLQLEAEHRLSLNDTVSRWLPGLVSGNGNDGSKITIRELLDHTSGLYNYTDDPRVLAPYLNGDRDYFWSPRQLVAIAVSHPPLFAPGTRWSYSNTNYIVAGLIVQAVTRESPIAEVYQRIIRPLGLSDTSFPVRDPRVPGPHLDGYSTNYLDVTYLSPSWGYTAGGIISTAEDLARFHRALFTGRLLPPAQQRELETTVPTGTPGQNYGLGVLSEQICGRTFWGHDGDFPGYYSLSLTSSDGSIQLTIAVDDDALIGTTQFGNALNEVAGAALCGSAAGNGARPALPAVGSLLTGEQHALDGRPPAWSYRAPRRPLPS